jgi:hypothetical protein
MKVAAAMDMANTAITTAISPAEKSTLAICFMVKEIIVYNERF